MYWWVGHYGRGVWFNLKEYSGVISIEVRQITLKDKVLTGNGGNRGYIGEARNLYKK